MVFNKNKIVWKCKLNLSIFLVCFFFFLNIDAGIILKINSSCGCFELQSSLSDWVKHVFQNKKVLRWSPFLARICCSKFKPNHQTKVSKNSLVFEQKLLEKKQGSGNQICFLARVWQFYSHGGFGRINTLSRTHFVFCLFLTNSKVYFLKDRYSGYFSFANTAALYNRFTIKYN